MRDPIVPTRSRARIAAENRAELDGWIDERADALAAAGMTPEQARRRALEEFGDVDVAARYAERQDVAADRRLRVVLWVEDLASDLRIALRTFARTPTVTVVVLLTFALGIGTTTAWSGPASAARGTAPRRSSRYASGRRRSRGSPRWTWATASCAAAATPSNCGRPR